MGLSSSAECVSLCSALLSPFGFEMIFVSLIFIITLVACPMRKREMWGEVSRFVPSLSNFLPLPSPYSFTFAFWLFAFHLLLSACGKKRVVWGLVGACLVKEAIFWLSNFDPIFHKLQSYWLIISEHNNHFSTRSFKRTSSFVLSTTFGVTDIETTYLSCRYEPRSI